MTNKDPERIKLEQQIARLEQAVKILAGKVSFLERENNRRKDNINNIAQHINRK
jgi:outer membrane murein-binding lipoprotein Lpp